MFSRSQKSKDEALLIGLGHERSEEVRNDLAGGANPNVNLGGEHGFPLFRAQNTYNEDGSLATVNALLDAGADINLKNAKGRTPFQELLNRRDYPSLVKVYLERGAGATVFDDNTTPLGAAVKAGFWRSAGALLDHDGDLERLPVNGETMLAWCVKNDAPLDLIRRLMEKPMDVNAVAPGQAPALLSAVQRNRQDVLEYLLGLPGVDVNIADSKGRTPLLDAVDRENAPAATALLKAGADPDRANVEGTAPLVVSLVKKIDLPLMLLKAGAAPDVLNRDGNTPLQVMVLKKNIGLVQAFLDAGAKPDIPYKDGRTPLLAAIAENDEATARALLSAGAAPGLAGADGLLPVTAAARRNSGALVAALLRTASKKQLTLELGPALFAAMERKEGGIIEQLVLAGADVNVVDGDGRTPLMKAALAGQHALLPALIKAGAKPEAEDRNGMRAYDLAIGAGQTQAKDYLARFQGGAQPAAERVNDNATAAEQGRYIRLNNHCLEIHEAPNLSMVFNFWMQQVVMRDPTQAGPLTVQNFDQVQRQESIVDAWNRLKAMGGDPPAPAAVGLQKKVLGLMSKP